MTVGYLANIKFLVVDDNAFMRTIVRRVLATLETGEVKEAADGGDALKLMKTFTPDIAIVDWEMQPIDGIEFVKMVRMADDSPNSFLPVIMLSGYSDTNRILIARDAGINEFVVKPISVKTLYNRIQNVIERPRQFVRTKSYFGPDRRRKEAKFEGDDKRGTTPIPPLDESLDQDKVNTLFNPDG